MSEYIEVFRKEAKSLLKDFKKNDKSAIIRCNLVFGQKSDLSLMNIQHVIAKEYGFNNWNELVKAQEWQQAQALASFKNKNFVSSLQVFKNKNSSTTNKTKLKNPDDLNIDMKNFTDKFGYPFLNFEYLDVSQYDLSELNITNVQYSEYTRWPEQETKLPKGFNPKEFLEYRKNPGLKIRQLHKQGIDGHDRNVAIIDPFRLFDHLEYHNQIKGYEEIHIDKNLNHVGFNAPLVSSLVGQTCGVAPKANLYYYAVDVVNRTQVYYAQAIRKVITLHKKLIEAGQNGIDAILILGALSFKGFQNEDGYTDVIQASQKASELGIWCRIGPTSFKEHNLWREDRIYCKFDGNVDNPDDFILSENSALHKIPIDKEDVFRSSLNFPNGAWSHAQNMSMKNYIFDHRSGPFGAAYAVGLYLLAKSVYPKLTPEEYWHLGIKTGDFRQGIGTIINPQRLINELKK